MSLVLTGTTGHLGSRVLQSLLTLDLIPASKLIISSSNPSKVPELARSRGVEIRHGDFTVPSSLAESFKGASALLLISFPSPSVERWGYHRNAIDAAKAAGVQTVIYTSLMFGGRDGMQSVAGVQQAHIRTVNYLRESGLKYVIVREGIYAESWWLYAGFQPREGFELAGKGADATESEVEFVIPNDGPVAWVSWDELGEATARILAEYETYLGQTLNLTGGETVSISEVAHMVERETGRNVTVKVVGKEEARKYHKARKSVPEQNFWVIDSWSGWHDGIAAGETSIVDPLLERLIGRKPRTMEEMARRLFVRDKNVIA